MADQIYSFRTALNGFHRGDVIAFLTELTMKHEAQLEEKSEELRLAKEEIQRLEKELSKCGSASAECCAEQPVKPIQQTSDDLHQQELDAYRRAERCEREARLRAGKIYADVSETVDHTGEQLIAQEKQLTKISATISSDIAALQAAMANIRIELNATRDQMQLLEKDLQAEID